MKDAHCRKLLDRLSDYADGTLAPSLLRRLEGHLKDCHPCGAFIRNLRRTIVIIKRQSRVRAPAKLRRELRARLRSL